MASFTPLVSLPGVASCAIGGVIHLLAWLKGREASQLESLKEIDKLTDLKHKAHLIPILVAVRGRVWTDSPLKCELTDKPAAIVEESLEEQAMRQAPNSTQWVADQRVLRRTTREAPWALQDASHARLPVVHALNAGRISLELAGDRFTSAEQGVMRSVVDALLGWRVQGLRQREHILPVGALVTVVGELAHSDAPRSRSSSGSGFGGRALKGCVRSGEGRMLALQAPAKGGPFIVSSEALPEMVAKLTRVSSAFKTLANCCLAAGVVLVVWRAVDEGLLLWRRRKHRRRQEAEMQRRRLAALALHGGAENGQPQSGQNRQPSDHEPDLCSVCMVNVCDTLFVGCKHLCVCERCAVNLSRCPLCRGRSRPMTVYRA